MIPRECKSTAGFPSIQRPGGERAWATPRSSFSFPDRSAAIGGGSAILFVSFPAHPIVHGFGRRFGGGDSLVVLLLRSIDASAREGSAVIR